MVGSGQPAKVIFFLQIDDQGHVDHIDQGHVDDIDQGHGDHCDNIRISDEDKRSTSNIIGDRMSSSPC